METKISLRVRHGNNGSSKTALLTAITSNKSCIQTQNSTLQPAHTNRAAIKPSRKTRKSDGREADLLLTPSNDMNFLHESRLLKRHYAVRMRAGDDASFPVSMGI